MNKYINKIIILFYKKSMIIIVLFYKKRNFLFFYSINNIYIIKILFNICIFLFIYILIDKIRTYIFS